MEVWCEGCRDWYPEDSVHFIQFPRKSGTYRSPRRVRSHFVQMWPIIESAPVADRPFYKWWK